jgi:hypothetical protein
MHTNLTKSGFEIYSTRELVTVLGTEIEVSHDLEAKLNTVKISGYLGQMSVFHQGEDDL